MNKRQNLKNMRRRAAAGEAYVQNELAARLATRDFGFTDEVEARRWYMLAARQGYIESKWNFGTMLLEGNGGPKDVDTAMTLIEQSAHEGWLAACRLMCDIYRLGSYGVKSDEARARQWDEMAERIRAQDVSEQPLFGQPLPDL